MSRLGLPADWTIGLAAYIVGISLSLVFDYPTGALIVWSMAIIAIAPVWTLPGLLRRA